MNGGAAGGLPGPQTALAAAHLACSGRRLGDERRLLVALLRVKQAAALANRKAGVLPPDIADALAAGCEALASAPDPALFPVDLLSGGGGIAPNVNLNEVLAAHCSAPGRSVDAKAHANASQSSADVCHTACRLAVLEAWEALAPALDGLVAALEERGRAFAELPLLARTCLRDALPANLGDLLLGHAALLARRREAVARTAEALLAMALGGTVIGTGEGAPAAYRAAVIPILARLTGRPLRRRERFTDAAQNADDLGAVSSALSQLAVGLQKVAQDFRLLSSGPGTGFGELRLPQVMEGSSFFAGKSNPVVPESLLHACFQVQGLDHAAQLALGRGELQLHGFEAVAAVAVLDSMGLLERTVSRFDRSCVRGLEADEARCRAHAAKAHPR